MCLGLLLEIIWKHFEELSIRAIIQFILPFADWNVWQWFCIQKGFQIIAKIFMPKESENILKNYLIVDQWSSGRYHDQNYINMTKMNVPWIFFKKTRKIFWRIVEHYSFSSHCHEIRRKRSKNLHALTTSSME